MWRLPLFLYFFNEQKKKPQKLPPCSSKQSLQSGKFFFRWEALLLRKVLVTLLDSQRGCIQYRDGRLSRSHDRSVLPGPNLGADVSFNWKLRGSGQRRKKAQRK